MTTMVNNFSPEFHKTDDLMPSSVISLIYINLMFLFLVKVKYTFTIFFYIWLPLLRPSI